MYRNLDMFTRTFLWFINSINYFSRDSTWWQSLIIINFNGQSLFGAYLNKLFDFVLKLNCRIILFALFFSNMVEVSKFSGIEVIIMLYNVTKTLYSRSLSVVRISAVKMKNGCENLHLLHGNVHQHSYLPRVV